MFVFLTFSVVDKQQNTAVNAASDLEPIYTYRGHLAPVLSLCMGSDVFYSGDASGEIICWSFPANVLSIDQYEPYDSSLQSKISFRHDNAVWALDLFPSPSSASQFLCSASADGSLKIWDVSAASAVKTIDCQGLNT